MKKIILATQNAHKLEELRSVLPDGWEVQTAFDAGIRGELPETGTTLEENATQKVGICGNTAGFLHLLTTAD